MNFEFCFEVELFVLTKSENEKLNEKVQNYPSKKFLTTTHKNLQLDSSPHSRRKMRTHQLNRMDKIEK